MVCQGVDSDNTARQVRGRHGDTVRVLARVRCLLMANDAPARRIEHRAVDRAKTVRCPHCGRDVDTPRMEPWLIHGTGQYALRLVAFECPHCEHEIRLDD